MSPPRNDIETATTCPICHVGFAAVRRQLYCTPACRQAAWRARATSTDLNTVSTPVLPARGRREHTVYACTECDQRYLGEQWCYDCVRPCIRVGLGGSCPSCDEPVVLDELLNLHNDDLTAKSRENPASTKPGAVHLAIRIIDAATGELLRELVLDTSKRYQGTGRPPGPTR